MTQFSLVHSADFHKKCQFRIDIGNRLCYAEYVGRPFGGPFYSGGNVMIQELIHDPILLARKSVPAEQAHLPIAQDLLDTLLAHKDTCVGMAANMIGKCVRIIVFDNGGTPMLMLNPEILSASGEYETEEGCLSLLGGPRKTKRFQKIKVRYQTTEFQTRLKTFTGWTAQIIQHEVDHCNGILI